MATIGVPDDCHNLSVVQDMIGSEVGSILGHQRVDVQLAIATRSQPCVVRHDVRTLLNTANDALSLTYAYRKADAYQAVHLGSDR